MQEYKRSIIQRKTFKATSLCAQLTVPDNDEKFELSTQTPPISVSETYKLRKGYKSRCMVTS